MLLTKAFKDIKNEQMVFYRVKSSDMPQNRRIVRDIQFLPDLISCNFVESEFFSIYAVLYNSKRRSFPEVPLACLLGTGKTVFCNLIKISSVEIPDPCPGAASVAGTMAVCDCMKAALVGFIKEDGGGVIYVGMNHMVFRMCYKEFAEVSSVGKLIVYFEVRQVIYFSSKTLNLILIGGSVVAVQYEIKLDL